MTKKNVIHHLTTRVEGNTRVVEGDEEALDSIFAAAMFNSLARGENIKLTHLDENGTEITETITPEDYREWLGKPNA